MTTAKFPSPSPQKPIGAGLTDWSIQSRASVAVSNAVTIRGYGACLVTLLRVGDIEPPEVGDPFELALASIRE